MNAYKWDLQDINIFNLEFYKAYQRDLFFTPSKEPRFKNTTLIIGDIYFRIKDDSNYK
jgi:hypothetical protein